MLPNDINMLVSMLNMKLRDDDMALETVIEVNDGNVKEIMDKLESNGFYYDESNNQIKAKQTKTSIFFVILQCNCKVGINLMQCYPSLAFD